MAHLGGAQHRADNTRVFGLLELWLCHTDWWTYSHRFESMSNGLGVWLAVKAQNEGSVAFEAQELEAHADLTTAYHSGGNKQSTRDNHIRVSYGTSYVAAQQVMVGIAESGMKSRRATAIRVVSFVGTKGNAYFDGSCKRKRKRGCSERDIGKSKKQKGSNDGGQDGQKPVKPKCAEKDVPETALHAGDNALDAYHSMSQEQREAALVFCKAQRKLMYGSDGRAEVFESESPDESSAKADAAAVTDDSGAPSDDKDSVIAMEATVLAGVPFGRAAYDNPAGEGVWKVTLVEEPDTELQPCSGQNEAVLSRNVVAVGNPGHEMSAESWKESKLAVP
jgi:hypothetical protein